jgi:hypothetical protein
MERQLERELRRIGADPNDRQIVQYTVDTYFHIIQNSAGAGEAALVDRTGCIPSRPKAFHQGPRHDIKAQGITFENRLQTAFMGPPLRGTESQAAGFHWPSTSYNCIAPRLIAVTLQHSVHPDTASVCVPLHVDLRPAWWLSHASHKPAIPTSCACC